MRLPDFSDRRAAEAYAAAEFQVSLVTVVSVVEYDMIEAERRTRERKRREIDDDCA